MKALQTTCIGVVLSLVACGGFNTVPKKISSLSKESEVCVAYVNDYLKFHDLLTAGSADDARSSIEEAMFLEKDWQSTNERFDRVVSAVVRNQKTIISISEYSVECSPESKKATIWFKIEANDQRWSRLYVVYDQGKIRTNSKELSSMAPDIDIGKEYFKISESQNQRGAKLDKVQVDQK